MTNERSNPGPDIDQTPRPPSATPAATHWSDIRTTPPHTVSQPAVVTNPVPHGKDK